MLRGLEQTGADDGDRIGVVSSCWYGWVNCNVIFDGKDCSIRGTIRACK